MPSPRPPTILEIFLCAFPILCTFSLSAVFFYYFIISQDSARFYSSIWGSGPPHLTFNNHPYPINLSEYFPQYFSYPPDTSPPPLEEVPECHCKRPLIYFYQGQSQGHSSNSNKINFINSTCSDPGTFLSPLQKVISYSLYLFPDADLNSSYHFYSEGLQVNLAALRKFYPGFTLRFYTNLVKTPFCPFYCSNPDLFWCNIQKTPLYGDQSKMYFTTWRFLPLGDPSVDIFLSRDLDSLLSQRESAVVQDWLQLPEKKAIHLMRDKYGAHDTAILGGMWGAKNGYFGVVNGTWAAELLVRKIRKQSRVKKFLIKRDTGFDQEMLRRVVFEGMGKEIVAYDSYHCMIWNTETMVRPFPVRRINNKSDFVGNVGFGKAEYNLQICPWICRPSWGKDWDYC